MKKIIIACLSLAFLSLSNQNAFADGSDGYPAVVRGKLKKERLRPHVTYDYCVGSIDLCMIFNADGTLDEYWTNPNGTISTVRLYPVTDDSPQSGDSDPTTTTICIQNPLTGEWLYANVNP